MSASGRGCGACGTQKTGAPPGPEPLAVVYLAALSDAQTTSLQTIIEELCPKHRRMLERFSEVHRQFIATRAPS